MTENGLYCPECGTLVTKAGAAWSGRTQVQQYRCHKCGRCTIKPLDTAGQAVEAKPFSNKEA